MLLTMIPGWLKDVLVAAMLVLSGMATYYGWKDGVVLGVPAYKTVMLCWATTGLLWLFASESDFLKESIPLRIARFVILAFFVVSLLTFSSVLRPLGN